MNNHSCDNHIKDCCYRYEDEYYNETVDDYEMYEICSLSGNEINSDICKKCSKRLPIRRADKI